MRIKEFRKQEQEKRLDQLGFIDEYRNGFGWWSSVETMAKISAREWAWREVGFIHGASYLAQRTWEPKDINKLTDEDLLLEAGIGKTVLKKLRGLPKHAQLHWQTAYLDWWPDGLRDAKKAFERRKTKKSR